MIELKYNRLGGRLLHRIPFGIGERVQAFSADGSLRSQALRGSIWTFAAFGIGQVLRLGSNLILTRVLFPDAFGLMALVNVFMQGLQMLSEIGIGSSIVQHKEGDAPSFLRTAWTLQVIRGVLLWLCACLVAWPVSVFYREPQLLLMMPVAALTVLILGFQSTAIPLCSRRIQLKQVSLVQVISQVLTVVCTVVIAYNVQNVWALVWGSVFGTLIQVLFGHVLLSGIKHRFQIDRRYLREVLSFGQWLLLASGLGWLGSRIDQILLPRLLDFDALGIVSIAFALAALMDQLFARGITGVLFPAISLAGRHDRTAIARAFSKSRLVLLPLLQLAFLTLSFGAPVLFYVFYPQQYSDASWVAQLLLVGAWFNTMSRMVNAALLADGVSKSGGIKAAIQVVVATPACYVGAYYYGLTGLLVGGAVSAGVGYFVMLGFAVRAGIVEARQDCVALVWFVVGCLIVLLVSNQGSPVGTIQDLSPVAIIWAIAATGLSGAIAGRALLQRKMNIRGNSRD